MSQGDSWEKFDPDLRPSTPSLDVMDTGGSSANSKPEETPRKRSKSRAPTPSIEENNTEAKTPRKDSAAKKPILDMFKKAFTSEKPIKDLNDIRFDLIGKSFFYTIPELNHELLTQEEWTLIGKAYMSEKPEDKRSIVRLIAIKGVLDMFKVCEKELADFVDKDFLEELASIATITNNDIIAEYLRSKSPFTKKIEL